MGEDNFSDAPDANATGTGEGSLFSILRPSPPPRVAGTGSSDDVVAELKRRLDRMEKNISTQPVPATQPGRQTAAESGAGVNREEAVLSRLSGLEVRLAEIADKLVPGIVSARAAEESKAGARREIEELLKVVREQQKYSEMDRQLHEQIEKSWHRVEELEKKLMEVYSGIVTGKPNVRTEELELNLKRYLKEQLSEMRLAASSKGIDYKEFDAKLEGFYGRFEEAISRGITKISAIVTESGGASATDTGRLEAEMRKGILSLAAQGESIHKEIQAEASRIFAACCAASAKVEAALVAAGVREDAVNKDISRLARSLDDVFSDLRRGEVEDSLKQERFAEKFASTITEKIEAVKNKLLTREELEQVVDRIWKDISGVASERLDTLEKSLRQSFAVSTAHSAAIQELADIVGRALPLISSIQMAAATVVGEIEKSSPQQLSGVSGIVLKRNLVLLKELPVALAGDVGRLEELNRAAALKATEVLGETSER